MRPYKITFIISHLSFNILLMQYIISCPGGCATLLKNELKALGYPLSLILSPSTVQCEADESAIARINLRSRIANKVYVVLGT